MRSSSRARRAIGLTLLAALPLLGCYRRTRSSSEDPLGPITIKVISHNTADVRVYAVRSGMRVRIGQAGGLSTTTFDVTLRQISANGEFQLLLDAIGGTRPYLTESIRPWPGQIVELTIESQLDRSSLSIFDKPEGT